MSEVRNHVVTRYHTKSIFSAYVFIVVLLLYEYHRVTDIAVLHVVVVV